MLPLKATWLENAYRQYYVDAWLLSEWGYAYGWVNRFPEMVLKYSIIGGRYLDENKADNYLNAVRIGRPDRLPRRPRRTWESARVLAAEICEERAINPVDWFTGVCGNFETAWAQLDYIPEIGPKISSFIMRDLSFLRDYSTGQGSLSVSYRKRRDRRWFQLLRPEDQALFIPIDIHVHRAARRVRASRTIARFDVNKVQRDPIVHRQAATEIVRWARKHEFDPRLLDIYWYGWGAGEIRKDGTPVE